MPERDLVTFGLAYLGYLLLCFTVVRRARGGGGRLPAFATAIVVLAHVSCVWAWRFEGSLRQALDKSIPGFVVFHSALLLILLGTILPSRWSTRSLVLAFAVVSAGALPAPFRYDEIRILAVPMFAAFVPTALCLVAIWRKRLRAQVDPRARVSAQR
jgi:hypothetical protein